MTLFFVFSLCKTRSVAFNPRSLLDCWTWRSLFVHGRDLHCNSVYRCNQLIGTRTRNQLDMLRWEALNKRGSLSSFEKFNNQSCGKVPLLLEVPLLLVGFLHCLAAVLLWTCARVFHCFFLQAVTTVPKAAKVARDSSNEALERN